MDDRSRQQRASDLAAYLGIPSEEVTQMGLVLLRRALVSLVLQCLLLVVGVATVRQIYRARHLGVRSLLRVAASGPLLGLSLLNLADWIATRRLSRWVKRVIATSN